MLSLAITADGHLAFSTLLVVEAEKMIEFSLLFKVRRVLQVEVPECSLAAIFGLEVQPCILIAKGQAVIFVS